MAEQVAEGHFLIDVGVVHLEGGKVLGNRIVPLDLALIDEQAQRRRRERLGDRADGEHRVCVHRHRLAELADAVALGDDYLVVLDHGQRQARNFPFLERLLNVGMKFLERLVGPSGRRAEPSQAQSRTNEQQQDTRT